MDALVIHKNTSSLCNPARAPAARPSQSRESHSPFRGAGPKTEEDLVLSPALSHPSSSNARAGSGKHRRSRVVQSSRQAFTVMESQQRRKRKGGGEKKKKKEKRKKSTLEMWQNAALQIGIPMGNSFAASHKNPRCIPPLSSVMVWAPFIKNSQRQREIHNE